LKQRKTNVLGVQQEKPDTGTAVVVLLLYTYQPSLTKKKKKWKKLLAGILR